MHTELVILPPSVTGYHLHTQNIHNCLQSPTLWHTLDTQNAVLIPSYSPPTMWSSGLKNSFYCICATPLKQDSGKLFRRNFCNTTFTHDKQEDRCRVTPACNRLSLTFLCEIWLYLRDIWFPNSVDKDSSVLGMLCLVSWETITDILEKSNASIPRVLYTLHCWALFLWRTSNSSLVDMA